MRGSGKLKNIIVWYLGINFIMMGFVVTPESIPAGLLTLLAGVLIIPPFGKFVEKRFNYVLSGPMKMIGFSVLFFVAIILMPEAPIETETGVAIAHTVEAPQEAAPESKIEPPLKMTPSKVVTEFTKAHKYGDYEKMYSLMSTEYRSSKTEANFRTQIEAPRKHMEQVGNPIRFVKVTGEEISGNSATVEFMYELQAAGFTTTETVELVKETDGWRIVNANYNL